MKILVKSDVYNICNRVKNFDKGYRLVYDTSNERYEIYSTDLRQDVEIVSGVPLSYVCLIPYNQLDERVINYLYDTRIENIEDIITQIDKHNQNLEASNNEKLKEQSLLVAENKLRQLT